MTECGRTLVSHITILNILIIIKTVARGATVWIFNTLDIKLKQEEIRNCKNRQNAIAVAIFCGNGRTIAALIVATINPVPK